MNPKKAKENAKKRFGYLLSSNKGNDKGEFSKIKWDMHKEFNLNFHDKSTCEHEIVLNPETFQGIQELNFIEIISSTNCEIRLLFKLKKCNLDKIKSSISILSVFSELIKNQNENLKLSTVYVRPANISDYFVDKITLLFKEQFLSRKDIFQITQSLIDTTVFMNKDVKFHSIQEIDEMNVGTIASFKGTKMRIPLTGIVTSSTDFQLRSLSSGLYFLVEITKDTYDFSFSSKTKFELIIEFLKQTIEKLKQTECSHIVKIIFFTRIFFTNNKMKKLLKKKFPLNSNGHSVGDYIYKSSVFPKEYFFDIYSNIIKVNLSKLDKLDMVNMLYKGFEAFASIFKTKNLSEFITIIRKNYDLNLCKSHSAGSNLNSNINNNYNNCSPRSSDANVNLDSGNFTNNSSNNNHSLNFNNFFCPQFFDEIDSFRMTTSNTSNIFESVNLIINDMNFERKKMYKLGNLVTVISSGEYFPYYNYRLSKLTKEGLFEHAIPCCMVILSNDSKAKEIYTKYSLSNDNERDLRTSWSNDNLLLVEEKTERGLSMSVKGNLMKDEDNLKMIIAKNYGIMDNLNANKICFTNRKNSSDNYMIKDSNFISYYKYESDTFNHRPPKWIKIFFINSFSLNNDTENQFDLGLNRFMDGSKNYYDKGYTPSFMHRNRFNSSDREGGEREREITLLKNKDIKKFPYNIINSVIIENDIFNAKKNHIFDDENLRADKIQSEYQNLASSFSEFKIKKEEKRYSKKNTPAEADESKRDNESLIKNKVTTINIDINHVENDNLISTDIYSINSKLTLKDIIDISNIYKPKYREIKNMKSEEIKKLPTVSSISIIKNSTLEGPDDDQNNNMRNSEISTKSLKSPTHTNLNLFVDDLSNTDDYKELKKKGGEYDHEVFNVKNYPKNSKANSEIENVPCSNICKRNLVLAFEFSDTADDFSKLMELLSQVPLLPIFGEFDTHAIKEDVGLNIHSVTTPLNSDINILEEIIFERINNNYQIVRNTNLADYNKPLDLKNIDSILLYDRRFYHIISTDELNYKVKIYNYSNKLNKYFSSGNNLLGNKSNEINRTSIIFDNDFNLEYNYFIYDFKINLLSGKKLTSTLGEKNNIYWYKYDHLLNEIHSNLSSIKFKNELHFLLIDRLQRFSQKKSKFYFKSNPKNISFIQNNFNLDSQNFAKEELGYFKSSHSVKNINLTGDTNSNSLEISFTNRVNSNNNLHSLVPENNFNYFNSSDTNSEIENSTFKERITNLHSSIDFYISKYSTFNEKLSDKIFYSTPSQSIQANDLSYTFTMLRNPIDWVLLVENKLFHEKNPLFFSFRWLSCNSIPIYNFYKDLIKRSKLKDILLIKIPCDDVIYSNFRRICIWNFPLVNKANILDEVLMNSICSNFLKIEFDSNYLYYNEEYNMLIKISQKGCVYLLDEVSDNWENTTPCLQSLFIDYSIKLDRILDLFDYMNHLTERVEKIVYSNISCFNK